MGYNFCWPGNFYDVGPFWCNIYDEQIFKNILDNLIEMSELDWQSLLISNNIDKYITYDEHNSLLLDRIRSFQ
jgi:surface carbohydrate biosynthesis protein